MTDDIRSDEAANSGAGNPGLPHPDPAGAGQADGVASAGPPQPDGTGGRPRRRLWRWFRLLPAVLLIGGAAYAWLAAPEELRQRATTAVLDLIGPERPGFVAADPPAAIPPLEAEPSQPIPTAGDREMRLAAIEAAMSASADILTRLENRLADQESAIGGLSDRVDAIGRSAAGTADAARLAVDTAELARAEARRGSGLLERSAADADARRNMLEADVKALVTSLGTMRAQLSSLEGRLEAVAGDVHLMARFGYGGRQDAARPAPSETVSRTPSAANYFAAGSEATGQAVPGLVQGRHRIGDRIDGHGVVRMIRRTPEGDHLVTDGGKLFAPAADPSPATEE